MSKGIAEYENGLFVRWCWIHDGNKCVSMFGSEPIPDPLPEGYAFASSPEETKTPFQLKIEEVQAWWQAVCDAGFDTGLGWTLAMQDADRDKLDQARNQLLLKAQTVIMGTYFPPPLFDQAGIPRVQNGVDQLAVLNAYAEHVGDCVSLFGGYIGLIGQGNLLFTVGDPLPEVV